MMYKDVGKMNLDLKSLEENISVDIVDALK